MPILSALADIVQTVFHFGGEPDVHYVREILYEEVY